MRISLLLLTFLLLPHALCHAADPAASSAPAHSIQIERIDASAYPKVVVSLKVLEADQPKLGLQPSDFRVTENDSARTSAFAPAAARSFALVVDTSGSMNQNMSAVTAALKSFIGSLGVNDQIAIIGFSRNVAVLSPLQADKGAAKSAVDGLIANGESALYDALAGAAEALKNGAGRRIIVLLTDSVDDDGYGKSVSSRSAADALAQAKSTSAQIFAIALGEKPDRALLGKWTSETGGTIQNPSALSELTAAYQKTAANASGGYEIAFSSTLPGDGQNRTLRISVADTSAERQFQAPLIRSAPPPPKSSSALPTYPTGSGIAPAPRPGTTAPTALGIDSAAPVPANSWFPLPPDPAGRYYSFQGQSGQVLKVSVSSGSNQQCNVRIFTSKTVIAEIRGWNGQGTPAEFPASDEKIYFSSRGGAQCNLLIETQEFFDAGSRKDAGVGEASALPLSSKEDATGFLSSRGDLTDYYKLGGLSEGQWTLIARPSPNCSISVQLLNDLGEKVKSGVSKNLGAGVSLPFDVRGSKAMFLRVDDLGDQGRMCAYVIRYGPGDVEAPLQPELK